MNWKTVLAIAAPLVLAALAFSVGYGAAPSGGDSLVSARAERVEVLHFHATQQCWSCTTVGELALKTVAERFPQEYAAGRIVFRDVNYDLPANRDLVIKYQARGSSLFVSAVANGQESIGEDVTVWRLVNDERQFLDYFEGRLKGALGD